MSWRELNILAKTTKEIWGAGIKTIPIGTHFIITHGDPNKFNIGWEYSLCKNIEISSIWNDEFEVIQEDKNGM